MATVSQTITLQDRVTPVLNTIIRAMRSTLIVMRDIDTTTSNDFMHARNWERATKDIDAATASLHSFQVMQDVLNKEAKKTGDVFKSWKFNIIAVNSTITLLRRTMDFLRAPTKFADTMTNMASRLALINDGTQTQEELSQKIYESAQRSRAAYSETVESVSRLSLLAKGALPTNDDAIKFSEIMSKAFAISGANVQEMNGAMRQMVQALSSGRLQGDEFVSITENAPLISQAIQKYLGVGFKELRQLSRDAKITSDIIVEAVFKAGEEINQMFSRMPMTFEQTLQHIYNAATRYVGNLVGMFSSLLNSDGFILWRERVVQAIASAFKVAEGFFTWLGRVTSSAGFREFVSGIVTAFRTVGAVIGGIARVAMAVVEGFFDNWRLFGPVVLGAVTALMTFKAVVTTVNMVLAAKLALTKALIAVQYVYALATGKVTASIVAAKAATLGLNTALLASPITWTIAGIAAAVGVLALMTKGFTDAGHTAETVFGTITNVLRNFGLLLRAIAKGVAGFFVGVWAAVTTAVINTASMVFNAVTSVVNGALNLIDRGLATVLEGLRDIAYGAAQIGVPGAETMGNWAADKADQYREQLTYRRKGFDPMTGEFNKPAQYLNMGDTVEKAVTDTLSKLGYYDDIPWNTGASFGDESFLGGDPARKREESKAFEAQRKIDQKMVELAMADADKSASAAAKAQDVAQSVQTATGGKGKETATDKAIDVTVEIDYDRLPVWYAGYRDWDRQRGFTPEMRDDIYKARGAGNLQPWFDAKRYKDMGLASNLQPWLDAEKYKSVTLASTFNKALAGMTVPETAVSPTVDNSSMADSWGNTLKYGGLDGWGAYSGLEDLITPHDALAVEVTGGKLDSERELSADLLEIWREFLHQRIVNQYTTEKPTVNATFGDVRETADVGKLITALENVVGQAFNAVLR